MLVSIPCKTWSAARSQVDPNLPHSQPLRTQREPLGIPRSDGTIPAAVDEANRTAVHAARIMHVVHKHGGFFIAEAPPGRGMGSRFPMPGREDHTSQFDHPAFVQLREETGAECVYFDQCRTRDDPESSPEKKTALLASPGVITAVRRHFFTLVCNHSAPHPSMIGVDSSGVLRSSVWQQYSSRMNCLLARCLHKSLFSFLAVRRSATCCQRHVSPSHRRRPLARLGDDVCVTAHALGHDDAGRRSLRHHQ